jgi:DNA-binding NarL/FixJ family response regulator
MNNINIILIDEHPIVRAGLTAVLANAESIEIVDAVSHVDAFLEKMKHLPATFIQVVILDVYNPGEAEIENIKKIRKLYGKIDILLLTMYSNENFILKSIKAGAKGILSNHTTRNEIVEAIYTLRNGFEYLGKSITNILLNSYINRPHQGNNGDDYLSQLSQREIEVLKLFGDGFTNQEIADKLFISIRTVETHKNNIMKKINLRTTVDLVKFAIRNNIIEV